MKIDVVMVLYHSDEWLEDCVKSLAVVDYNLGDLNLIWVDNADSSATAEKLAELQKAYPNFGGFSVVQNKKNTGFGAACNKGAGRGTSPYILFLNADTEVFPDIFAELKSAAQEASDDTAGFECRQLPFETGHHVDPVSMQTTWSSAAAWMVRRDAFAKAKGFDERIFMYCEDVDLSWRLRALGYGLVYVPAARLMHHTYGKGVQEVGPAKLGEYAGSFYGDLMLRYKFGSFGDILKGHKRYLGALHRPKHFPNVRKVLAKNYLKHFLKLWAFWFWRWGHRQEFNAHPAHFDGGFSPDRGIWQWRPVKEPPLVSVVVRTCNRPDTLRQTLKSLRHQTYKNFEVVVVEDGPPESQKMVETEFPYLSLRYFATGVNIGRGRAGNVGLSKSKGLYCNFLDDDDYFYPDHIEMLVSVLQQHGKAEIVTAASMAMEANVISREPYKLDVKKIYTMLYDRLDNFMLCQGGLMSIQSVMFKRELFERYGGLHEEVDGNEDWYMWMKYFTAAKRINYSGVDIHRATTVFMVPANKEDAKNRHNYYQQFEEELLRSPDIRFSLSPLQMRAYYFALMGDMLHLRNQGKLDAFLQGQADRMKGWNPDGKDLSAPDEASDDEQ